MACEEKNRELLHAYLDGELDLAHGLEVERHMQACAECAAEYRAHAALRVKLKEAAPMYSAPAALKERLRAAIPVLSASNEPRTEDRAPARELREWRGWRAMWPSFALGAAAMAVVMLAISPMLFGGNGQAGDVIANEAIAGHLRSLMANHLTDVLSSDQHTVKPWFNGKLNFAPDVQDFAAQGFPLAGGRLDYIAGQPAAALVYHSNKHVINVFIWPGSFGIPDMPQREMNREGYTVLRWTHAGMHTCVVSDLNATELKHFAGLLSPLGAH